MAWQQSDLIAIEAALKTGALKVKYQDRDVTYRSVDELLRIRDIIAKELGMTSGKFKVIHPYYDQGLS